VSCYDARDKRLSTNIQRKGYAHLLVKSVVVGLSSGLRLDKHWVILESLCRHLRKGWEKNSSVVGIFNAESSRQPSRLANSQQTTHYDRFFVNGGETTRKS